MSIDGRSGLNNGRWEGERLGNGIYSAKVVSVIDPTFMGTLKVTLLKGQGNTVGDESKTYPVRYASPFMSYSPIEATGSNNNDFNDTQKSSGIWAVPPDIGVTVLCMFIDGNPAEGFWLAVVPPRFANHMTPAIGAVTNNLVAASDADKALYDTEQPLPVGEVNKRHNTEIEESDAEKIPKPIHPIASRFLDQGLLEDDIRGYTLSSSRRKAPSSVYGMSTPGPLDYTDNAKRMTMGTTASQSPGEVPVSRLGGTQLVFDDGDDQFLRSTNAGEGPVKYVDVVNGTDAFTGDPTTDVGTKNIPYGEYARLRTRTGHQILLHNSEDLIYIGNARGTAWIEMTSNGKIDVYANDSISIHSENDLNIRADRDINIEAGRNINMKATAEYESPQVKHRQTADGSPSRFPADAAGIEAGRIQLESAFNTNILANFNMKIEALAKLDINVGSDTKLTTGGRLDVKTNGAVFLTQPTFDLSTTAGDNKLTATGTTHIKSGSQHIETAPRIDMNGPEAAPADTANPAQVISPLTTHTTTVNDAQNKEWVVDRYADGTFQSIVKRVPMHEPWAEHENFSPQFFNQEATDREIFTPPPAAATAPPNPNPPDSGSPTAGTGTPAPRPQSTPATTTGAGLSVDPTATDTESAQAEAPVAETPATTGTPTSRLDTKGQFAREDAQTLQDVQDGKYSEGDTVTWQGEEAVVTASPNANDDVPVIKTIPPEPEPEPTAPKSNEEKFNTIKGQFIDRGYPNEDFAKRAVKTIRKARTASKVPGTDNLEIYQDGKYWRVREV